MAEDVGTLEWPTLGGRVWPLAACGTLFWSGLTSLGCAKRNVSSAKWKDHPHQTTSSDSCAFFHDTGAFMHDRKASRMHAGLAWPCLLSRVSRSSTKNHTRRGFRAGEQRT